MVEKAGRHWLFVLGMPLALAMGILSAMLALGHFNATLASAQVTGVTVAVTPNTAGDPARYEVRFITSGALAVGDEIIIQFHQNFQVPSTIDRNQVTARADFWPPTAADDVAVSLVGTHPAQQHEVRVTVPDLDPADASVAGIAAGAEVTVVFRQAAGINNPTKARHHAAAGAYIVTIWTSADPDAVATTVTIPRLVELRQASGPRGTVLTLLARGYRASTTLTFWRDANSGPLVIGGSGTRTTSITVGEATVVPTPQTVVPNQRVSLVGSDFTSNATISIITIGGQAIPASRINQGATVFIDSGGNWSADIDLPVNSATTTAGTPELKVIDSAGREGVTTLTFLERTIAVTPAESVPGSDISVSGANFPARNDDGSSINITVSYDTGSAGSTTTTVTPDASGKWNADLQVPTASAIPSTNVVRAQFQTDEGVDIVTATLHQVPRARITLSPASGPPGTEVTVTGCNFRPLTAMEALIISGIDVTPQPSQSTDAEGCFTATFTVPSLDLGTHTVQARVGGVTAIAPFQVVPLPPDIRDVVIILQITMGLVEPSSNQKDLNHDEEINVFDAILGLQHIVGLIQMSE